MISVWRRPPTFLFAMCGVTIAGARTQPEDTTSAGNTTRTARTLLS
jgi:hypothetical protein